MHKTIYAALLFVMTLVLLVPVDLWATSCHPQEFANHLKYSQWVFIGTASEANLVELSGHSIEFTLSDIDRVRGNPPDQVRLKTSKGAYNPDITIGKRYIVYTSPGDLYVHYCNGFSSADGIEIFQTIVQRRHGDCGRAEDRQSALFHTRKEFLSQDWTYTVQMVREFLDSMQQQNPDLHVVQKDERITVKGFEFIFVEGSLIALELVECDV